jgi:hypothetical protein
VDQRHARCCLSITGQLFTTFRTEYRVFYAVFLQPAACLTVTVALLAIMAALLLAAALLAAALPRTAVLQSQPLMFATCVPSDTAQQFYLASPAAAAGPGGANTPTVQIKDRASGRCLVASNCSAAGLALQPEVVLAACEISCSEWTAVPAAAGATMFELHSTTVHDRATRCSALNAPVTGLPVAWAAVTCDPTAGNNQWVLSNATGTMRVGHGPAACSDPSDCCLAVAPPPP